MLDLDLNLEAELSIDSIKRIEILGTLGQRLGFMNDLGEGRDKAIEKLATMKTLREIVAWLEARQKGGSAQARPGRRSRRPPSELRRRPPPPHRRPSVRDAAQTPRVHRGIQRFVPVVVIDAAARARAASLAGTRFVVAPDSAGIATEVVALLRANGATARLDDGTPIAGRHRPRGSHRIRTRGRAPEDPAKGLFERARALVLAKGSNVLAVTHIGAPFGPEQKNARSGAAGLVRTLAKEAPNLRARSLALDPREPALRLAEHVVAELGIEGDEREVAHVDGARKALVIVPAERIEAAPGAAPLGLDASSVVLVTGGARGITAAIAVALAKRFRCRLELCGRSPLPDAPEDPDLAGAPDLPALRRAIIAQKKAREPASIEALASKVLAAREIRATLEGDHRGRRDRRTYHAVDVRDGTAFGALLDDLHARHGHIDGLDPRRRRPRRQAPRAEVARLLRSRLRHQGRERAHPRLAPPSRHPPRRLLRERLRRLRQPRPDRLLRRQRRPRQARVVPRASASPPPRSSPSTGARGAAPA